MAQDKIQNLLAARSGNFNYETNLAYHLYWNGWVRMVCTVAFEKFLPDIEKNGIGMNAPIHPGRNFLPSDPKLLGLCAQLLSRSITQDADPVHALFTLARLYALDKKWS